MASAWRRVTQRLHPLSASAALGAAAWLSSDRNARCWWADATRRAEELHGYVVGPVLGEGAFSVVKQVTSRATGEAFALKVIAKGSTPPDVLDREVSPSLALAAQPVSP